MRIALPLRAAVVFAILLVIIVGLTHLAQADFTSALTVDVEYPAVTSGSNTVGGIGVQQVFRLGGPAVAQGIFAGLDPKVGTCSGGSISFLSGNSGAIGSQDFVYALKVTNTLSNVALDTILSGACLGRTITSIGFCQMSPNKSPFNAVALPMGVDFFFKDDQVIPPPNGMSAILFYTSPDPPMLQPTSIGSSGVSSNGNEPGNPGNRTPIYGACPTLIMVDKKIGCTANGPFTDGPQAAIEGAQVPETIPSLMSTSKLFPTHFPCFGVTTAGAGLPKREASIATFGCTLLSSMIV